MVSTAPRTQEDIGIAEVAPQRGDEVFGASQVGPFDYVPRVGFREYWYPGVWSKKVGRKPVNLKMLGDELVLFRGKDGNVVALNEWCPHRGARLSRGFCEFKGTVTCPYHGYTFDETGKCVAGLIETEDSPMVGKMRSRKYPTAEWRGIVFIWMGQTEPVPLEEDLPWEFKDSTLNDRRYTRVKDWEVNWTEPVNQGVDYHEFYLHRNVNFWRFMDWRLPFWRPKPVYTGGVKIVEEGDDFVTLHQKNVIFGEAEYPGLGKWPRKTWWRKLKSPDTPVSGSIPTATGEAAWATYNHNAELPSKVRVCVGTFVHMRWGVPLDEHNTRMWTFTLCKTPKTFLGQFWQDVWYYFWRKPAAVVAINEKEDLVVFKKERLNLEGPQKLSGLDIGVIRFRNHLARRSRDFRRLGGAHGCIKQPPDPQLASRHNGSSG